MDLKTGDARLIIDACRKEGLLRNQAAYVLATAFHESAHTMKPINEVWGPTAAQRRYEGRVDLGNTVKGDGRRFAGRGYVQITGRRNYADWAKRLGIDLTGNPVLALVADNAVRILVQGMKLGTFTGKKLSNYISLSESDFANARRIINGTDRADLIAGYAKQYDDLLLAEQYGIAAPQPAPPAPVQPIPAQPNSSPPAAAPAPPVAREPQPFPAPVSRNKTAGIAAFFALLIMAAAGFWHHLTDLFWSIF